MHKRFVIVGFAATLLMAGLAAARPASAQDAEEMKRLEAVKGFLVQHGDRLAENSRKMSEAAAEYYDIVKSEGFDYAKAHAEHGEAITDLIDTMKVQWLQAHNNYEAVEGIVAGIPSLAKYDLIIDAGVPESEGPDDVSPYDMTLPDGTVMKKPGNIFHFHLEPALWGTLPKYVGMEVDLNGDGKVGLGEVLPEANITLGAAKAHTEWSEKMMADVRAWKPNRADTFTAIVTMVPTVGDYFEEWKASKFVTGDLPMFVAQTRLVDVKGIMRSTQVMYFDGVSTIVQAADSSLDAQVRQGFLELLAFVDGLYLRERAGETFKPEEVDALGSEAQDMADRITALVTQAAKKLNVELKL
jgi:Imelysin